MIFSSIQIIREERLMQDRFPKSDWKLFREKLPDWQETYMDKLNQEYIQLLSGDDCPSEKFWKLDKRIKEDKKSPGVQLRISRSDLFFTLLALLNDGVIGLDDLADFSDDLKETARMFYERQLSDGSEEE
jgi:hypothetical protein